MKQRHGCHIAPLLMLALAGGCTDLDSDSANEAAVEHDMESDDELRTLDLLPDPDLIVHMNFAGPGELGENNGLGGQDCVPVQMTAVNDGRAAAGFNGVNSSCSFSSPNAVAADGAAGVSISVWIRPRAVDGIIYRQNNGAWAGYQLEAKNGVVTVGGRAVAGVPYGSGGAPYNFPLDTWHHVVGVLDYATGTVSMYFDGVEVYSRRDDLSGPPEFDFTPGSAEMIGAYVLGGHSAFDGRLHDLRVYRRSLSPEDASAIYDATRHPTWGVPIVDLEFAGLDLGHNEGIGGNCSATGIAPGLGPWAVFEGDGSCAFATSTGNLADTWGSATISAWVNPGDTSDGIIYRQTIDGGNLGYQLGFYQGTINLSTRSIANEGVRAISFPWPYALDSGWHHVAGVVDYEGRELSLYVDGVLQAGSTPTWAKTFVDIQAAAPGPLAGRRSLGGPAAYVGGLDKLRVYTRSFSAAEIFGLY